MKKIIACTFLLLITLIVKSQNTLQWIKINSGNEIPANAVVGGKDGDGSPLFVAHGNYEGNWHPGKTRKDWNGANIEYGGNEVTIEEYEVLTSTNSSSLKWSNITAGNIPDNAVKAGQEGDRPLFACRCDYEGSKQVGKTWQGSSACNIGYGGGGFEIAEYEVLVSVPQNVYAKPQVTKPKPIAASTKNEKCLPIEITNTSQKNVMTISYDNNNHVTGFIMNGNGLTATYVVTSDAKGNILSILNKGVASSDMMSKVLFAYDLNGRLTEAKEFLGTGTQPAIVETYTYNISGQLTQRKQVTNQLRANGTAYISYTYNVYAYPNPTTKNPSTITIFRGNATGKTGTQQQVKVLTYDDKKNIGGAFPGTMDDFETFATNNVISADVTFVTADIKETQTITYEYNESGYPISKTYKANGGITYTDNYNYNCLGSDQSNSTALHKNTTMSATTIGTQIWGSKNLDVITFANGDPITQAQSPEEWLSAGNENKAAWCYYENNSANGSTYGILYNWYAIADSRGLAPKGWHIPTKYEWITLLDFIGGKPEAGYKLKSTRGWQAVSGINRNGSDSNGFAALPGGLRFYEDGTFDALGTRCQFWTATENEAINGAIIVLGISNEVIIGIANKKFGYSVRCVKD
jgi:uncharacterized protein (TIGR02145 family)